MTRFNRGYPNLAAYQDSDEEFMLYRRFGYLQARVLLDKQDKLRQLERELDVFDAEHEGCAQTTVPNSRTQVTMDARNVLLGKIDSAVTSYCKF